MWLVPILLKQRVESTPGQKLFVGFIWHVHTDQLCSKEIQRQSGLHERLLLNAIQKNKYSNNNMTDSFHQYF